jgi:hypothetical protein
MTPVPSLKKGADGRYHGTYHNREFAVWKTQRQDRYGKPFTAWVACQSAPASTDQSDDYNLTRSGAVCRICQEIDRDLVQLPEIDQLLERWAEEIRTIALALPARDLQAHATLERLSYLLADLDNRVRLDAVRFEQQLVKLKAHVRRPDGPAEALPATDQAE